MIELRQWRESLPDGLNTLEAAGGLLGVTGVQMYRYERGLRRIPPEKVKAISKITKIRPEVLRPDIFGKPQPIKPRVKAAQQQVG
jgi:DNA-binding transcriptional regulator YdaS (Cro superfamily)